MPDYVVGEFQGHPLGAIPSPPDPRDFRYPAYAPVFGAAELPEAYTCDGITEVDNQGAVSSCVAHSLGVIKDWQEYAETGIHTRHSRQFIYSHRPNEYYWKGPGMIPREALQTLRDFGVVREEVWPGIVEYGKETWPAPLGELLPQAQPFQIATYVAINPKDINEIKSAIVTTGPILLCVPVYDNFIPDANGRIPYPKGNLRGYHGMAGPGYERDGLVPQNSWGREWGVDGKCILPWGYPIMEIWGITDATTRRVRKVHLRIGSKTITVDGSPREMDVAPFIQDSRTFVPLRFVAEGLGATVDYGPKPDVEWVTAELEVPAS